MPRKIKTIAIGFRNCFSKDIRLYKKFEKSVSSEYIDRVMYIHKTYPNIDFKFVSAKDDVILYSNRNLTCLVRAKYPWIFGEIFGQEIYKFHDDVIDEDKKYVVFDIGANLGYASLYFAQKKYVKKIYAFELIPQNVEFAKKNISLNNSEISGKIEIFPYGLGKAAGEITADYLEHRDGISGMNETFLKSYAPEEVGKTTKVSCRIEKSSTALKEICDDAFNTDIILKIDVEGAEYEIFEDLVENFPDVFKRVIKIVGDTHLGFERFINILSRQELQNFIVVWKEPHDDGTCPFELSKE